MGYTLKQVLKNDTYIFTPVSHSAYGMLYRVTARKDLKLGHTRIYAGTEGGFVSSPDNIQDNAWVYPQGMVLSQAVLSGQATTRGMINGTAAVSGQAEIHENAIVSGNAVVDGKATIGENVTVMNHAYVSDNAHVAAYGWRDTLILDGTVKITGTAKMLSAGIIDKGCIGGDAVVMGPLNCPEFVLRDGAPAGINAPDITRKDHYLYFGMVGSESVDAYMYRTDDGSPYMVVGCWNGYVKDLMDEVALRRKTEWVVSEVRADLLYRQYEHLYEIAQLQAKMWKEEEEKVGNVQ